MKRLLWFVIWLAPLLQAQDTGGGRFRLLALGDINLGRTVGQILLRGSIDYPFVFAAPVFRQYDVVFANLESQVTDQGGETQHPRDRYIFSAPPQAAAALSRAGISLVSTANNHAFDYGMRGLVETVDFLEAAGIRFTGSSKDSVGTFPPALVERNGITLGFVAYTEFVNQQGPWQGRIALFDPVRARSEIGTLKDDADFIVASYHGGVEYVEKPPKYTLAQMRKLIDLGADVVIGHHPHVPQGMERYKGKWIFYSLGNFLFLQPQREWTQKSYAVSIEFVRDSAVVLIDRITLVPVLVSNQPSFEVPGPDRESIEHRLMRLSSTKLTRKDTVLVVQ
jgi:poly-gamma-glutamate synthesis protein (capsule biosynthesis protein)